jgi:hypothetical protein
MKKEPCCYTTGDGHSMVCYEYESPIEIEIEYTIKQLKELQKRLKKTLDKSNKR